MTNTIRCKKGNRDTALIDMSISWSGDSITGCALCAKTIWDADFDATHDYLPVDPVDRSTD